MPVEAPVRSRLDRDRIVEALLEIGIEGFSMHSLARRLGVSATALYRHFESREALLAAAMDHFCARVARPTSEAWDIYLEELAVNFRFALLEMPGAADYASAIGPASEQAFALVEGALAVLRGAGFAPREAWIAYVFVIHHTIHSVQRQERFEALNRQRGPKPYRVLELGSAERERFPSLAAALPALDLDFERSFQTSLTFVIDGLRAEQRRQANRSPSKR